MVGRGRWGPMRGKLRLTNLRTFHKEVTGLVDQVVGLTVTSVVERRSPEGWD